MEANAMEQVVGQTAETVQPTESAADGAAEQAAVETTTPEKSGEIVVSLTQADIDRLVKVGIAAALAAAKTAPTAAPAPDKEREDFFARGKAAGLDQEEIETAWRQRQVRLAKEKAEREMESKKKSVEEDLRVLLDEVDLQGFKVTLEQRVTKEGEKPSLVITFSGGQTPPKANGEKKTIVVGEGRHTFKGGQVVTISQQPDGSWETSESATDSKGVVRSNWTSPSAAGRAFGRLATCDGNAYWGLK